MIAASLTVLLSGLSLMGAVQDAIPATSSPPPGRAAEIALLSAGLLVGVIIALKMGIAFHLFLDPGGAVAADISRFGVSTRGGRGGGDVRARLVRTAPLAARGRAGRRDRLGRLRRAHPLRGVGPVIATGLAAVLIGLASEALARPNQDRPARDRPVRDHPAAARAHRVPRLYQLAASRRDVADGLVTSRSRWPSASRSPPG